MMLASKTEKRKLAPVYLEDLNGIKQLFPEDLPGYSTLVLFSFSEAQQESLQTWIYGAQIPTCLWDWVEISVRDDRNMLAQWLKIRALRCNVPDRATRGRVHVLFVPLKSWLQEIGFSGIADVRVAVITRKGDILALEEGDFAPEKWARLEQALKSDV
jgi:hypothetical protein